MRTFFVISVNWSFFFFFLFLLSQRISHTSWCWFGHCPVWEPVRANPIQPSKGHSRGSACVAEGHVGGKGSRPFNTNLYSTIAASHGHSEPLKVRAMCPLLAHPDHCCVRPHRAPLWGPVKHMQLNLDALRLTRPQPGLLTSDIACRSFPSCLVFSLVAFVHWLCPPANNKCSSWIHVT